MYQVIQKAINNHTKNLIIMKALVKVNGQSVGFFYNMTKEETQAEMHKRILDLITYRFGSVSTEIIWEQF